MPSRPGIFTNIANKATGADVELTPLTAVEPDDSQQWRQRFQKQVNRNQRAPPLGEAASYYDPTSRFSPVSVELPRKIRVNQKKRMSKWRVIFMIVFVISFLANVAFITLFVYWYITFKQIRTIWNETFAPQPTASASFTSRVARPSPSS